MKLLLDTHVFLWMLQAPEKLTPKVLAACDRGDVEFVVSVASVWEIQIKQALGKLEMDIPLAQIVDEQLQGNPFKLLDIAVRHVLALDALPRHHGDPFDRLLIAQAVSEGWAIVTADRSFQAYPVERFW